MALYHKAKTVENGFGSMSVTLVTWLKPGANESTSDQARTADHTPSRNMTSSGADLFCVIEVFCGFLSACKKCACNP
jgi:hypothetical protein